MNIHNLPTTHQKPEQAAQKVGAELSELGYTVRVNQGGTDLPRWDGKGAVTAELDGTVFKVIIKTSKSGVPVFNQTVIEGNCIIVLVNWGSWTRVYRDSPNLLRQVEEAQKAHEICKEVIGDCPSAAAAYRYIYDFSSEPQIHLS